MPGLMIIAHAPLASALKAVAEHTFPDCAASLAALDVTRDMSIDDVEAAARVMLARCAAKVALSRWRSVSKLSSTAMPLAMPSMKSAFSIATLCLHLRGDRAYEPIIAQGWFDDVALSARKS